MGGRVSSSISGRVFRVIVACVVAGGLTAGCGSSSPSRSRAPGGATTANAQGCLVGAAWLEETSETVSMWEEPALQKAMEGALGYLRNLARKPQTT